MFFDDIIFNIKDNDNKVLFDHEDGFMYGNMFRNEYDSYKNYRVAKLDSNTEIGKLLLKIYQYDFALNDLSLYLDLHPEDMDVYKVFKKYTEELREYVDLYEKKNGPMELDESNYNNYLWYEGPWPFIGGGFNV
ncbi:MAG: spore coat protein CotJB [Firmicutes bacterium]|nr:spore coat protein CotJB [Bacillota bacterium]